MTPEEQLALIRAQIAGTWKNFLSSLPALRPAEPQGDLIEQAQVRRERAKQTRLQMMAGVVLLLLALPGLLVLLPYHGHTEPVTVVIEQGLGRRGIAAKLTEEGVLRSRWPFLLYTFLRPWNTLKAGEYRFEEPLSPADVFHRLNQGAVRLYVLTVLEGWTRWEIAEEIERLQLADGEAFLRATKDTTMIYDIAPQATTLEGYLYPDTYHFARPAGPRAMVRTMVNRFRRVYDELQQERGTGGGATHAIVTLASLVEEETGSRDERGLIAGVYTNRLRRQMLLQCDPTVIYAARLHFNGVFDGIIHQSDLRRPSPYNTYVTPGLPPGPIAAPGRAALAAALRPIETDYLYFVSNTEGGHYFARTAAEHKRNVSRYRRRRRQKQQ